jgi:HEAT repeat protein
MKMMLRSFLIGTTALGLLALPGSSSADEPSARTHAGRASVYDNLSEDSLEDVSTPDAIMAVTTPNIAPTRIWSVLEHGEKVECLACIPYVAKLLYDGHAKTREISAWWLRRRMFGVFGENEVYSQVVATLGDQTQPENQRVYAANALGEFLSTAGIKHVSAALLNDPSPAVREASAFALQRLNNQGVSGALALAMSDPAENVRVAALKASMHVNVFTGVEAVLGLIGDGSPAVRRVAAEALGVMHAGDAVGALMALTSPDVEPDASVRLRAVWALGQLADEAAKDSVQGALSDPDQFVRDAATAALRRL